MASSSSNPGAMTFSADFEVKDSFPTTSGYVLTGLRHPDGVPPTGTLESPTRDNARIGASTPLISVCAPRGAGGNYGKAVGAFRRGVADEPNIQKYLGTRKNYIKQQMQQGISREDAEREFNAGVLAISVIKPLQSETSFLIGDSGTKATLVSSGIVNFIAQEDLPASCYAGWALETDAERRARFDASLSGTSVVSDQSRYIATYAAPILRAITPATTVQNLEALKRAIIIRRQNATSISGAAPNSSRNAKPQPAARILGENVMDTTNLDFLVKMAVFLESAGLTLAPSEARLPATPEDLKLFANRQAFYKSGAPPDLVRTAKMFPLGEVRQALLSINATGARSVEEASPVHALGNLASSLGLLGAKATLSAKTRAALYQIAEGTSVGMELFAGSMGNVRKEDGSTFLPLPESNTATPNSPEWAATQFRTRGVRAVQEKKELDVEAILSTTRPAAQVLSNSDTKAGESVQVRFFA